MRHSLLNPTRRLSQPRAPLILCPAATTSVSTNRVTLPVVTIISEFIPISIICMYDDICVYRFSPISSHTMAQPPSIQHPPWVHSHQWCMVTHLSDNESSGSNSGSSSPPVASLTRRSVESVSGKSVCACMPSYHHALCDITCPSQFLTIIC